MTLQEALKHYNGRPIIVAGPSGSMAEAWNDADGFTYWRQMSNPTNIMDASTNPIPAWYDHFGWILAWPDLRKDKNGCWT